MDGALEAAAQDVRAAVDALRLRLGPAPGAKSQVEVIVESVEHAERPAVLGQVPEAASHLEAIAGHVERAVARMRFQPVEGDAPFHDAHFGGTPRWPEAPVFPSFVGVALEGPHALELRRLLDALETFGRQLIYAADCQEYVDALNTSREYLRAAGHLDLAAPHALALRHLVARTP